MVRLWGKIVDLQDSQFDLMYFFVEEFGGGFLSFGFFFLVEFCIIFIEERELEIDIL